MTQKLAPGNRGNRQILAQNCIYTIKHSDDLKAVGSGGSARFSVGLSWVTGKEMVDEARRSGERVPVVFAPAEKTKYLFALALLDEVILRGKKTAYSFSGLHFFPNEKHLKTSLRKVSDGNHLSAGYIRPYSICGTPSFIDIRQIVVR